MDHILIRWHHILANIDPAEISHDRVENFGSTHFSALAGPRLWNEGIPTPEEWPVLLRRPSLQVQCNLSNGLNSLSCRSISREQDIEISQVALDQTLVKIPNLLRAHFRALDLTISGMITCFQAGLLNSHSTISDSSISSLLKCTVSMAATSHPNDCMTNVAIVFPT